MSYKLHYFDIKEVQFGSNTVLADNILTINKTELQELLLEDSLLTEVDIEIVRPGESARIINVMDIIEPRVKLEGPGVCFPGFIGDQEIAGRGITNVLRGISVIQTGKMQGVQEGIIEMSGPGANLSVFSKLHNIVLVPKVAEGIGKVEFDEVMRATELKAASYIADVSIGAAYDSEETFELEPVKGEEHAGLPKIAYVYHLQSQGPLRNTFIYGRPALGTMPVIVNPTELMDGAVVSSNYIVACQKNPTYIHLNNPVVLELARRHGKDVNFVGVIFANENSTLPDKKRSAIWSAKLAEYMQADGVVITQEGGGHADTDLMLVCQECEKLDIKTVIIANEIAGPEGKLPSLVSTVPEAVAMVSTGNNDEVITLPKVEHVVGGKAITGRSESPHEAFSTALGIMYTATNQLGVSKMTVKQF